MEHSRPQAQVHICCWELENSNPMNKGPRVFLISHSAWGTKNGIPLDSRALLRALYEAQFPQSPFPSLKSATACCLFLHILWNQSWADDSEHTCFCTGYGKTDLKHRRPYLAGQGISFVTPDQAPWNVEPMWGILRSECELFALHMTLAQTTILLTWSWSRIHLGEGWSIGP